MDQIEWRHLKSFVIVAEEGHITRAAERLNTQQPPLSLRIRALERRLNVQLFRRKARGVELTEVGRVLLAHARTLLEQQARMLDAVQRAARGQLGRLSIGVTPTGPLHPLVPASVRAFRERYPETSVTLDECLRDELLQRLRDEQLDVAFLRSVPTNEPALAVHTLLTEPMLLALPRGHRLARSGARAVKMRALADESFIVYARQQGPAFYDSTVAACLRAGFSPRIVQEAPRITTALGLVAAGLGASIVPESMRRIAIQSVVFRSIEECAGLKAILAIGWRRNDASQVLANFVNLVRRRCASNP